MTSIPKETAQPLATSHTRSGLLAWLPKRWYAHLILWIACILIGFPLFYAMLASTQNNAQIYAYQFYPGNHIQDNWTKVMVERNLGTYMFNSVLVAVIVTVGKTVLSLLAGLAFVYFRFPGKWLVFGFVLLTLMMPTEILVIALFRFVNSIG